jgi:transcriptional regulator of heat shock response
MNEKYIQALILGSIIGFAIVIDDYIGPKSNDKMMQKKFEVKDIKRLHWNEDSGKKIDFNELEDHGVLIFKADEEVKKDIRIKINSDDMSDIDIQSIFEEIQAELTDEEFNEVRSKLEDARSELENALTEASDQLDDVDIDIQVEVENN